MSKPERPARVPKLLFLLPGEGRRVKDPITRTLLSPAGEWKPENSFWLKKVSEGDAIVGEPVTIVVEEPETELPADETNQQRRRKAKE